MVPTRYIRPRVSKPKVDQIHSHLHKVDSNYNRKVYKADHKKNVPNIVNIQATNCVITPYSFDVMKCDDVSCCGVIRTPTHNGICELAIQRQATSLRDPKLPGHLFCCSDALEQASGKRATLTDLTNLPSVNIDPQENLTKARNKCNKNLSQKAGLQSWE